ncbi:MAG: S-layer homology domain-containing protein [Clostridiales bacterium]|nr:S-layer homology domain-containing protein [Clostridiales bacterium]
MSKKNLLGILLAIVMMASLCLGSSVVYATDLGGPSLENQAVNQGPAKDVKAGLDKAKEETLKRQVEAKENMQQEGLLNAPLKEPAEEKTFILKKADGTELGQYDNLNSDIINKMKSTDPNGSYIIEVTKDYEFEGASRSIIGGLNITFTSKEGKSPVLMSGNGMPHFFLQDGNYTFKNIILEGKSGSTGGGIYTHDDNQGITITLDSGTVIRNCNYIDAPYSYRPIVIRDKYTDDGKDSTLIINDGVTIEGCKTNSSNAGCAISVRDKCKLIVNGGTFKNNDAKNSSYGGGAIFNDDEAETIINGGTFEGNKAEGNGGAVVNYGKLTINGGTFKNNEGLSGGAISSMSYDAELNITGGTFENNKSTDKWGGAIVAKNKVSVKNATFENNYSGNGGAIFAYNANGAVFENCTFKNNGVDNEKSVKQGGALFVNGAKDVSIKNNTFTKNIAQDGGALFVSNNMEGLVEGNTFEENFSDRFSSAFHVKKSAPAIKNNIYKNNGKKDDKTTVYGTLMVESVMSGKELTIENDKFENNGATKAGGALVVGEGTVSLKACEFTNNKVPEYGGAMYITDDGKVSIAGSKFVGNSAKRGGAIVTELFSQANPAEDGKYANLTIADDVEFSGNFASDGYFNPPMNYDKFPDLKFKTTSLMGKLRAIRDDEKNYDKVDSLLNNYDVYYVNPLVTVIYDANGGTPEEKIFGEELTSENDEIKPAKHTVKTLDETGLKKEGFELKGWNTQADGKGTAYKPGDELKISSNQILYAIWKKVEKPEPKPKPEDKPEPKHRRGGGGDSVLNKEDHYQYLIGYEDDSFKPENNMTREEVAVMFSRLLKNPPVKGQAYPYHFPDVDQSRWSVTAISYMSKLGIVKGYPDGDFKPEASITRAEFAAMAAGFADLQEGDKTFSDLDSSHWAYDVVRKAASAGWISGYPDGTFKADNPITRAEVVTITNKMLNRKADQDFVDRNLDKLLSFIDLNKDHWAYYPIMEATSGHDYIRSSNKVDEKWQEVTNKSFVYDK